VLDLMFSIDQFDEALLLIQSLRIVEKE